jgi:hypothetical protein
MAVSHSTYDVYMLLGPIGYPGTARNASAARGETLRQEAATLEGPG